MNNKRRNRKTTRGIRDGVMGRLFAQTKLPAHVSEEQDWYLDTPDVRLTRVFTIVLILHIVAVGGILAFKMIEKASSPGAVATISTSTATEAERRSASQTEIATGAATVQPKPSSQGGPAAAVVKTDATPGVTEYRVRAGDTLVDIARELGVSVAALKKENTINSENDLYPGRYMRVSNSKLSTSKPEVAVAASTPAPKPEVAAAVRKPASPAVAEPAAAQSAPNVYIVQKGDTAYGIARKFGINHTSLLSANGIAKPESMQIGQKLKIPAK